VADRDVWPGDWQVRAGQRRAPFEVGVHLRLSGKHDLRIANQPLPPPSKFVETVVDEHREINTDLRCGKTRAVRGRVRREHVAQQVPKVGSEVVDPSAPAVQTGSPHRVIGHAIPRAIS
jgi:hypothetical protein